jgi:putative transposase
MKKKLNSLKHRQGKDSMILAHLPKKKEQKFAIAGYQVQNSEMTLKDKLSLCEKDSLTTKLLKMSEVDSTIKEKDLLPFWNESVAMMSKKLWLPTKTDCVDLDSSLSSGLLNKTLENSWFSTKLNNHHKKNSSMIYCQSSTFFPVESMGSENTVLKSKKIRIYPNSEQKRKLREWAGVARYIYNQTIALLKDGQIKASWMTIKGNILNSLPDWAKNTPYQIKSIAVRDACEAVKNAKLKAISGQGYQKVKFRSKRYSNDNLFIPKSAMKERGFYVKLLGNMKSAESLRCADYDCRIVKNYDKWFVCIPVSASNNRVTENQGLGVIALDPGVRTFQSFYSECFSGEIGKNDIGRIYRLCQHLDSLISRLSKERGQTKRRMRKAANRIRQKIKNLVDEMHKKVAVFLCKNFTKILIPNFETSEMTKKTKRKINKKSVRAMLTWSHYRFKQFLKHKAFEYGVSVEEVSEAYTSKTCSCCGEINTKLAGNKIFKCKNCGYEIGRDINGARNVLLRALVDTPSLKKFSVHLLAVGNNC